MDSEYVGVSSIRNNGTNEMDLIEKQQMICERFGAEFLNSANNLNAGISLNVKDGIYPINGLRHAAEGDMTGWYIWAGDYSSDPDFFKPIHVEHLYEWCPQVLNYLGLAPGWRFLIAPDYEDVWQDLSLLNIV